MTATDGWDGEDRRRADSEILTALREQNAGLSNNAVALQGLQGELARNKVVTWVAMVSVVLDLVLSLIVFGILDRSNNNVDRIASQQRVIEEVIDDLQETNDAVRLACEVSNSQGAKQKLLWNSVIDSGTPQDELTAEDLARQTQFLELLDEIFAEMEC